MEPVLIVVAKGEIDGPPQMLNHLGLFAQLQIAGSERHAALSFVIIKAVSPKILEGVGEIGAGRLVFTLCDPYARTR